MRDTPHLYRLPARLRLNDWALAGDWTMKKEDAALNTPNGRIAHRFHARDLHLVMGPAAPGTSVRFRVLIDGQPPGAAHGIDVDEQGNGTVTEQRLYRHSCLGCRARQALLQQPGLEARRRLRQGRRVSGRPAHAFGLGVLDPLRHGNRGGGAGLSRRTLSRRARYRGNARRSRRSRCRRERSVSIARSGKAPRAARTRRGAATPRTPRSAIRTATSGCCRRSPRDCPDAWTLTTRHSPRQPSSPQRSAVRRSPTAPTKSVSASEMRTGPTGTPSTLFASRPASRCRPEQRL